ncbi:meiotic nuclear division protein 1 homolog [Artemia franciscana]|uniref:Meiotic nuclear division protein 1 homolog n=1 Tax=Artemia franciscana TaxID=6661 RepID=A0AA88LJ53_ARTSF|nr:hypothetical protein QYM36_002160 [Artemia franciscana]
MSKKRGLSLEEKRQRMIEIFYEKKEFFQLKELEKIGPKEKGIIMQSVKEVVQSLADDGLIDTDKIGTSTYFWAFPSKAGNVRKRKVDELSEKLKEIREKKVATLEAIQKSQAGREECSERVSILEALAERNGELKNIQEEIKKYRDCDPEALEETRKMTQVAKEAANRWTDNIHSAKSWCKNKFFIEEEVINKQFEIPEDLDYV